MQASDLDVARHDQAATVVGRFPNGSRPRNVRKILAKGLKVDDSNL